MDPLAFLAIFTALAMGGIVKGATGAGAPLAAIPVIAAFFDVRLAVMVMAAPNFLSNCWQLWQFRSHALPGRFPWIFAGGGALGCIAGTVLLASLPERWLVLTVALSVAGDSKGWRVAPTRDAAAIHAAVAKAFAGTKDELDV